jgi:hypothetical protein
MAINMGKFKEVDINNLIKEFANWMLGTLITKTEFLRSENHILKQVSLNPLNSEYKITVLIEYELIPKDFREIASDLTHEDITEIINKATPVLIENLIKHHKENISNIYEFISTNTQKYTTGQVEDVGLLEGETNESFGLGKIKGIHLEYYEDAEDIKGRLQRTIQPVDTRDILTYDSYILLPLIEFLRKKIKNQLIKSLEDKNNNLNALVEPSKQLIPMPEMGIQSSISLKKDFYKEIFDYTAFRKKYRNELNTKLENGLTLAQQLNNSELWFSKLSFKDLEMFTKLFGYIQGVSRYLESDQKNSCNFEDLGSGLYRIEAKTTKEFYKHFIKEKSKGKNKKGFLDRDKKEVLEWLFKNQEEKDVIKENTETGKIFLLKQPIYRFASQVTKIDSRKNIQIVVNTSILETEFKDYLEIETSIFEEIDNKLKTIKKSPSKEYQNCDKKIVLSRYDDLLIKFYLILKTIYNKKGTIHHKNGFISNIQRLKRKHLIERLGNLKTRIKEDLLRKHNIRKNTTSDKTISKCTDDILKIVLAIAVELKWLWGFTEGQTFTFLINPNKFDKKDTATKIARDQ